MLPSIPCCKWVKNPRPTCAPWLTPLTLGLAHPRLPRVTIPKRFQWKTIHVPLPWTSVLPLPTYFGDACGFLVLGRQSSSLLVGNSSLLVSSWVMVAWPCYCTDQWSCCLGTCISFSHPVLESILKESSSPCQDIGVCTASFWVDGCHEVIQSNWDGCWWCTRFMCTYLQVIFRTYSGVVCEPGPSPSPGPMRYTSQPYLAGLTSCLDHLSLSG